MKESEKKGKYLDLAREFKKKLNIKVIVITIIFGAFSTVRKGLLKGLCWIAVIQIQAEI